MLDKLEKSRKSAEQGKCRDAGAVSHELSAEEKLVQTISERISGNVLC